MYRILYAHLRMQSQIIKNVHPEPRAARRSALAYLLSTLYGAPFAYLALINTWRMKSISVIARGRYSVLRYDESERF